MSTILAREAFCTDNQTEADGQIGVQDDEDDGERIERGTEEGERGQERGGRRSIEQE